MDKEKVMTITKPRRLLSALLAVSFLSGTTLAFVHPAHAHPPDPCDEGDWDW
jgi:hypothetical protein